MAGESPEVGYTTFGPIFNLPCAISADNKDAIIERMTVVLEHARGQKINLTWARLSETFSEIRGPEGTSEVGKNQPAIALKVGTLVLAEKIIGFNDSAFQTEVRSLTAVAVDRYAFLRGSTQTAGADLVSSKEFADLIGLWERHFPWQEGVYSAVLQIHIVGVAHPTEFVLAFALSSSDVKLLRDNLPDVARYERELVIPPEGAQKYNWRWVYPRFVRPAAR
ncbi:MAG: hypothetical protein Q8K82_13760 [Gemmatimonadaceae bacterium]|nr:hypothetical protein [Gemmatimonadaceae bacterium]